jgi:hypothetical protein
MQVPRKLFFDSENRFVSVTFHKVGRTDSAPNDYKSMRCFCAAHYRKKTDAPLPIWHHLKGHLAHAALASATAMPNRHQAGRKSALPATLRIHLALSNAKK